MYQPSGMFTDVADSTHGAAGSLCGTYTFPLIPGPTLATSPLLTKTTLGPPHPIPKTVAQTAIDRGSIAPNRRLLGLVDDLMGTRSDQGLE